MVVVVTCSAVIPISADKYWKLRLSEEWFKIECKYMKNKDKTILESIKNQDDQVIFMRSATKPDLSDVPGWLLNMGPEGGIEFFDKVNLDPKEKTISLQSTPSIFADSCDISSVTKIVALDSDTCEQKVEAKISVNAWGAGSIVENLVSKGIKTNYGKLPKMVKEFYASYPNHPTLAPSCLIENVQENVQEDNSKGHISTKQISKTKKPNAEDYRQQHHHQHLPGLGNCIDIEDSSDPVRSDVHHRKHNHKGRHRRHRMHSNEKDNDRKLSHNIKYHQKKRYGHRDGNEKENTNSNNTLHIENDHNNNKKSQLDIRKNIVEDNNADKNDNNDDNSNGNCTNNSYTHSNEFRTCDSYLASLSFSTPNLQPSSQQRQQDHQSGFDHCSDGDYFHDAMDTFSDSLEDEDYDSIRSNSHNNYSRSYDNEIQNLGNHSKISDGGKKFAEIDTRKSQNCLEKGSQSLEQKGDRDLSNQHIIPDHNKLLNTKSSLAILASEPISHRDCLPKNKGKRSNKKAKTQNNNNSNHDDRDDHNKNNCKKRNKYSKKFWYNGGGRTDPLVDVSHTDFLTSLEIISVMASQPVATATLPLRDSLSLGANSKKLTLSPLSSSSSSSPSSSTAAASSSTKESREPKESRLIKTNTCPLPCNHNLPSEYAQPSPPPPKSSILVVTDKTSSNPGVSPNSLVHTNEHILCNKMKNDECNPQKNNNDHDKSNKGNQKKKNKNEYHNNASAAYLMSLFPLSTDLNSLHLDDDMVQYIQENRNGFAKVITYSMCLNRATWRVLLEALPFHKVKIGSIVSASV